MIIEAVEVTQMWADQIRYILLVLLLIVVVWSAFSTWLTFRNYRQMTAGHGRLRTRWICQIFLFLALSGLLDILLTYYRIGKAMSNYLFILYLAQVVVYFLMVVSATGFMLSLFGASIRRSIKNWLTNE
jgi:hypothetical protein